LSNTGFILGQTLNKMFEQNFKIHVPGLNLNHIFSYKLYSDEIGVSKPHSGAFRAMKTEARQRHSVMSHEILHVGDNPFADEMGAKRAGCDAYLINSNSNKIQDLLV
jgi:putative hydrolase of the HAD superfamily